MSSLKLFFVACLAALSMASPSRAEWLRGESEHFVVYGDTSESSMRLYVQRLERFDQLLRLYLPRQSEFVSPKLSIYLVGNDGQMRSVWPGIPATVRGFYARGDERIFAMASVDGETTLMHEYAHHYMFQNFSAPYPAWFVEGFAEYFANSDVRSNRVKVGLPSPGRMNSLTGGANSWAPMESLLGSRGSNRRIQGHEFYAQAWALTHYLMSTPDRQTQLAKYLRAIASGTDAVAAVDESFGRTASQLQGDVQRYLYGAIVNFTPQHPFTAVDVEISRISPAERDSLWLDLRLARYVPEARRAGNLGEAVALAARYPGEPMPARVLAQAHLDMKQPAQAVAVLSPIAATRPNDHLTLRLLAVSLMDEGDEIKETDPERRTALFRQARAHLAKAYDLDPTDYRVYAALARNRRDVAGYPTENDLETLVLAAELAPQLPSVRMQAARALLHHGRAVEAILQLRPIANDPHGGSNDTVQALLSEAYKAAGQVAADEVPPPQDDEGAKGEEPEDEDGM